jgi:hypothetical protein
MKTKSKFALGIFEDNKEVKKFTGIAEKSRKYSYAERTDWIPSNLYKFKLDVPSGKHEYTLKKINSAAPSISVRFKIENNDLSKR